MQPIAPKIGRIVAIVILIIVAFFCQTAAAASVPIISADKEIYNFGEMIKINFLNAPGKDSDWICIAPAETPDTEGGDYKYMPKGSSQGAIVFNPPQKPGRYEARAYYDYGRNGYVVSGRSVFTVVSSPDQDRAIAERMERKIDPSNPLEANIPLDKGLVYIFREALFVSWGFDVPIKVDGKLIATLSNSSYSPLSIPGGDVTFSASHVRNNQGEMIESPRVGEVTIKVRPGYVYYLKLRVVPLPIWVLFLDQVPHAEGANIIDSYKLTLLK